MTTVRIPDRLRGEAQVRAGTLNEETRTVQIIWAAGAPVKRYDWHEGGYYIEELSMEPGAVRMERFAAGMSLLDSHSSYSMSDRLGTVVPGSVRISGGKGYATVKFSRSEAAETIFRDLMDGHPFPVSVGYRTHAYERTEGDGTSLPVLKAIDWEPFELSAVAIPADPAAHSLRSETAGMVEVAVREPTERSRAMSRTNTIPDELHEVPETRSAPRQPAPAAARFGAKERREMVESAGRNLPAEVRADLLADHAASTEQEFRSAVIDAIVDQQEAAGIFPHSNRANGDDYAGAKRTDLMGEALFARANPRHQLSAEARPFFGLSTPELARACLENAGASARGLSASDAVTRALHATSDFPILLGNAAQRSVRQGYEVPESELRQTARSTTHSDFRHRFKVAMSEAPRLLKVNEHGEFKRGTISEGQEGYGLATFGRIIGFTRQLLINDDLSLLARIGPKLGQSAREFEIIALVALLEANPAMADGFSVFSAEHSNLLAGAALSVDSLSAARLSMRRQKGIAGEPISVSPKFLVVPAELETTAEKLLADIAATAVGEVNPFSRRLTLVVEPRLVDPKAWYLASDPAAVEGMEFAHLEGEAQPHIETRAGWDVDGVETKVRLDFGAGWLDHRGWVKNPGA